MSRSAKPLHVRRYHTTRLVEAIQWFQARVPGYVMTVEDGVISLALESLITKPDLFMNRRLNLFEVTDVSVRDAVAALRALVNTSHRSGESYIRNGGMSDDLVPRERIGEAPWPGG